MNSETDLANIETIELVRIDRVVQNDVQLPWHSRERLWESLRENFVTGVLVGIPTLFAAIYFLFIAADRYVSEARFVVRSPSSAAASQISNLVQGTGVVRSADDAYIVRAYMKSRDALRNLKANTELLTYLSRPEADFWWRYPGFLVSPSDEKLWKHFLSFVDIDYDSTTGITKLSVQGFRPEDAKILAEALIKDSERLINRMSTRAQRDAVLMAERELERSRELARAALQHVTDFRSKNGMIDPTKVSSSALATITRLALEIAQSKAQLAELEDTSPDSPQASGLRLRIEAFESQVRDERSALAGADTSLAPLIAEYDRLILEREFAEREFVSAQNILALARVDAERQRLFLELVSMPVLTDYPEYPWRLLNILIVFVISYIICSIVRRLLDDVRAHAEEKLDG